MEYEITDELKKQIVREHIEPSYVNEVKGHIKSKECWKISGHVFQTLSKVLVALSGILSFSSGYYNNPVLSFIAGSVSTISLASIQFAAYAYNEYKKQGQELNLILKKLKIDTMPIVDRDVYQTVQARTVQQITPVYTTEPYIDINEKNTKPFKDEIERLNQVIMNVVDEKKQFNDEINQLQRHIVNLTNNNNLNQPAKTTIEV